MPLGDGYVQSQSKHGYSGNKSGVTSWSVCKTPQLSLGLLSTYSLELPFTCILNA